MRAILPVVLLLVSTAVGANECRYSAERNLDIDPSGLRTLALVLGSSDASVEGVAGLNRIEVRGRACASEENWLADLTVAQSRSGDRVTVTPEQHHSNHFNLFGSSYAYVDLQVRMPAKLALEVKSASGDADISEVATLDFTSSSGDLKLRHVAGDVGLEVSSGDVIADDVGNLSLRRSGSGDITARSVHGAVKVGHVGSGDLHFDDVRDNVEVDSIGSGDVQVSRVGGDVTVGSIGSGDVTADGVGGNFTVRSAGSGDIRERNIKGHVDLPRRHHGD